MNIRIAPNEKFILEAWIDRYDEKTRTFDSRELFIVNEGDHLFICPNTGSDLRIKKFNIRGRLKYKRPKNRMMRMEQVRTTRRKGRLFEGIAIDLRREAS